MTPNWDLIKHLVLNKSCGTEKSPNSFEVSFSHLYSDTLALLIYHNGVQEVEKICIVPNPVLTADSQSRIVYSSLKYAVAVTYAYFFPFLLISHILDKNIFAPLLLR